MHHLVAVHGRSHDIAQRSKQPLNHHLGQARMEKEERREQGEERKGDRDSDRGMKRKKDRDGRERGSKRGRGRRRAIEE